MRLIRLISLALPLALVAMPTAATSTLATEGFGKLCLETKQDRRAVAAAAGAMGMSVGPERASAVPDTHNITKSFSELAGTALSDVTLTGFVGTQEQGLPEGVAHLSLSMNEVAAKDPEGRPIRAAVCAVISTEEAGAARAFPQVRSAVADHLPAAAVPGIAATETVRKVTLDTMRWHWGEIDQRTGRVLVEYRGITQTDRLGGGMLTVSRVVRPGE